MTSHYYPSYCESVSEYSFVGKVSVEEENRIDFVYQFVSDCNFEHHEDNANTYSIARHICGTPTTFPKYDVYSPKIFVCTFPDIICHCPVKCNRNINLSYIL